LTMNYLATITSKRQLTIPVALYQQMNFRQGQRVVVYKVNDGIKVEPKKDFWSLGGSLKSKIKLTDKQLRAARNKFSQEWAQND
ncbi:MAG: AbrB/MazE/SpoVT family DNA-binding domain-containing protein, partial [Patescibacteria group bacterium]|nr:AbrB/MazE/SpoVT family DNA-binding domain-containing protein [Patescibacteria group bacterium]